MEGEKRKTGCLPAREVLVFFKEGMFVFSRVV